MAFPLRASLGVAAAVGVAALVGIWHKKPVVLGRDAQCREAVVPKGPPTPSPWLASPYYYINSDPPDLDAIKARGTRFTVAFILAGDGCKPVWSNGSDLQDGDMSGLISTLGKDNVEISAGGYEGNKLGQVCSTADDLARAYEEVIDAYQVKTIDIDIEKDELSDVDAQNRVLAALKKVKEDRPGIRTILTLPTSRNGPEGSGARLIQQAAAIDANIDVFTIMPFNFGADPDHPPDIHNDTVSAANGLRQMLKCSFGWSDDEANAHLGISGMNGVTDAGEEVSTKTWADIIGWAKSVPIARVAFWSINRDRQCPEGVTLGDQTKNKCSGVDQPDWEFTKITAGFKPGK